MISPRGLRPGRPPFQEDSALETLVLVRTQDPLSPSRLRPRLPRDLETICLKCLRRQPSARYPTALALADDLGRFLAAQPIRARPTPAWERATKWVRRHPAIAAAAGAACVAAIAVAAVIGIWNIRLQRERDRAVSNLRKAREAVDSMVTRVSEVRLKELPQVEPVQRALLEDAKEFYGDFVREAHDDPEVLRRGERAPARATRATASASSWGGPTRPSAVSTRRSRFRRSSLPLSPARPFIGESWRGATAHWAWA